MKPHISISGIVDHIYHICICFISERGGGVEGSRGGGASEAGKREALSERGAGTPGEEEGQRLRIKLDHD